MNSTLPKIVMAKPLHLSRPSKRVGSAVRAWWAMRSQKRRRQRSAATAPTPPVPVIVDGSFMLNGSDPGWADVSISWEIQYGSSPVGSIEVWFRTDVDDWLSLGTVPGSDAGFYHPRACNVEQMLNCRARYVFEDFGGTVVGAFSNEYPIYVSF